MTTPLPAEIILPGGQPAYLNPFRGTYITNRTYALRMQRGYARGMSQQAARGKVSPTGLSEYALRAQRFQQKYGFTLTWWRRMQRKYVNEIEAMGEVPNEAWFSGTSWIEIVSADYDIVRRFYGQGPVPGIIIPPENYVEERLSEKLYVMEEYRNGNRLPGRIVYQTRENIRPIELWWYH